MLCWVEEEQAAVLPCGLICPGKWHLSTQLGPLSQVLGPGLTSTWGHGREGTHGYDMQGQAGCLRYFLVTGQNS